MMVKGIHQPGAKCGAFGVDVDWGDLLHYWQSHSALKLDGVDDYVLVPGSTSLDITDNITITAWVKHTAAIAIVGETVTCHAWMVYQKLESLDDALALAQRLTTNLEQK